jgi:F0F1-type ATP synthase alpha subunit
VKEFETGFYRFLESERPKVLQELASGGAWTDEIASALSDAIDEFRKSFLA